MGIFRKKDKYQIAAEEEANRLRLEDMKKARLLDKDMDYAFLEELIQKINENPLLQIKVTLHDGTVLDLKTKPKTNHIQYLEEHEDFLEVR